MIFLLSLGLARRFAGFGPKDAGVRRKRRVGQGGTGLNDKSHFGGAHACLA